MRAESFLSFLEQKVLIEQIMVGERKFQGYKKANVGALAWYDNLSFENSNSFNN